MILTNLFVGICYILKETIKIMQIKERLPSRGDVREQRNKTNFVFNGKVERMIF